MGRGLFDFAGLLAFKERLRPQEWTPIYLAYPSGEREFFPVVESLCAFARGRPLAFLFRTLRRAPTPVLNVLWTLLIPWTISLAVASPLWFPHEAMKWLWVCFDVCMVLGLRALARRWRVSLARLLASAATADAVLTALQLVLFNARRLEGPLEYAVASVAITAPAIAAILLWASLAERGNAHGRRESA